MLIDTLEAVKKIVAAGMPEKHAKAITSIISKSYAATN
jgi:hypothetical protein